MANDIQPDVRVVLTVEVRHPNNFADEEPAFARTFTSEVNTDANKVEIASKNVAGLATTANEWLYQQERRAGR